MRCYTIILILLLNTVSVMAQSEERALIYDNAHRSDIIVLGQLLQADTLFISITSRQGYALSAADFTSTQVHDSLLHDYYIKSRREDSIRMAKKRARIKAEEQVEIRIARRKHQPIPVFAPVTDEIYLTVETLAVIYRYKLRVDAILGKERDTSLHSSYMQLKFGDTISVLIPRIKYSATALPKKGNEYCVVYFKEPGYYTTDQLPKIFKTPELEAYYRNTKTYWLDTGRVEKDIWKPVIWQK